MPIFSAAEASTFAQAPLFFRRSELADPEVVQLHRGCAIRRGAGETAWGRIGICGVRLSDRATGAMAGVAVEGLTGIGTLGIADEGVLTPGASALSSRALSRSRASSLVARSWSSLSFV